STDTLRAIATIKVGHMPYGLATSPNGSRLLVASQSIGTVTALDTGDFRILSTERVGHFPEGIAMAPDGRKAYVANWFSGDVSVLGFEAGKELKRIPTGSGARALAVASPRAGGENGHPEASAEHHP